jgi:hypothetical protein
LSIWIRNHTIKEYGALSEEDGCNSLIDEFIYKSLLYRKMEHWRRTNSARSSALATARSREHLQPHGRRSGTADRGARQLLTPLSNEAMASRILSGNGVLKVLAHFVWHHLFNLLVSGQN